MNIRKMAAGIAVVTVFSTVPMGESMPVNPGKAVVYAADHKVVDKCRQKKKAVGKWKQKNGYFLYVTGGKRAKNRKKIGERTYYFDEKGIQRTGWQMIGGEYYFFRIANGKKGYMVTGKTVNHVKLSAKGAAVRDAGNTKRLKTLVLVQKFAEAAAKPADGKEVKLKKAWNKFQKEKTYKGSLTFTGGTDWDVNYAYTVYTKGHESCYGLGAAFAFLGNACGYTTAKSVSSGGHGWCEIDGKIYDPSWAKTDRAHNYYALDMSMSGRDGRPAYAKARKYIKSV